MNIYLLIVSLVSQDLSLAGLGAGLSENSNTRSSLLWEVKRVLSELAERERERELPAILLLENVTQLHSKKNMPDFKKWCEFLESIGYTNYWQDLNSKNYGIPQNRNRVFMVSLLNGTYNFPAKKELTMLMKDLLEQSAPEKYFLSGKGVNYVLNEKRKNNNWTNIDADISIPLTAKGQSNWTGSFVSETGYIEKGTGQHQSNTVYSANGVSPTLTATDYKRPVKVDLSENEEYNLKNYLCDKLINDNLVKEYDIVKHSYTNQILSGNKKCVEKNGVAITLTTRGDCVGVVVKDKVGNEFLINDTKQLRETIEQNELKENTCLDLYDRSVRNNVSQTIDTGYHNSQRVVVKDSVYTETEKKLFTEDGNIKRYINSDIVDKFNEGQMATTSFPNGYGHGSRTHNESVALNTIDKPSVKVNLRIRKLLPIECFRLMGVKDKDFYKIAKNQTDSSLYHLAGDSIVCYGLLTSIFGKLLGIDYEKVVDTDNKWWEE